MGGIKMETKSQKKRSIDLKSIDLQSIVTPIALFVVISALTALFPQGSESVIMNLRNFFTSRLGVLYLVAGLFFLLLAVFIGGSKFGNIKLGNLDKPRHGEWAWGTMIFTATLGADLLYYSMIEWAYYYNAHPMNMELESLASKQDWASTYSLFHWGPIAWAFYILPATAFAYMLYVKGTQRQKISEACRPILKGRTDGILGIIIDNIALIAQLAGVATTFSISAPLLTFAICELTGWQVTPLMNILVLLVLVILYGGAVLFGIKGISLVAKACTISFGALLICFMLMGDPIYIINTGVSAIGNLSQNLLKMATYTDPLMLSGGFSQDWTMFFWAFWIVWAVATPFFIGKISEGRTIRNMIFGGFGYGLAGTYLSFIVFGNFGLNLQTTGKADIVGMMEAGASESEAIISIINTTPIAPIILIILIISMTGFYVTTFDAVTMVVSGYSLKKLKTDEEPPKKVRIFWAVLFVLLPIALLFMEGPRLMLQSVAIIAAFPMGAVLLIIVLGFFKEVRKQMAEKKTYPVEKAE
ncbi:MAG: BCCT family transporter [Acetivibrionales bacterium]|jgi:BCCT family betaine/carnitine transporter